MRDKKPLEQLIAEHDGARKMVGKIYRHAKSGQDYQLLMTCHDTETQEFLEVSEWGEEARAALAGGGDE